MNNTKSAITSFSTRFFSDIKSQRLSKEVIDRFNCDSYISKHVTNGVSQNHNHWFVDSIFPLSKVILAVDSLNGNNTSGISIVTNSFQKYLKYIIWKCQNTLLTKNRVTQLTVVCICCLTFTEGSMNS